MPVANFCAKCKALQNLNDLHTVARTGSTDKQLVCKDFLSCLVRRGA